MSNNKKVNLVEVHAIVNAPASCLNANEVKQPKETNFAGYDRTRVSSQSQKFAMRTNPDFKGVCGEIGKSIRTANIHKYVLERLSNVPNGYDLVIRNLCDSLGKAGVKSKVVFDKESGTYDFSKLKEKDLKDLRDKAEKMTPDSDRTAQILVLSPALLDFLVETIEKFIVASDGDIGKFMAFTNQNVFDLRKDKKITSVTLDTALFGAMSASAFSEDVPASMHVGQMFSTHEIVRETDFYIAADDFNLENPGESSGAASMGDIPFNSSCFYKYAALDLDILRENLKFSDNTDEVIKKVIPEVLRLFITTLPKGKQNTNAAYVLPDMICITLKDKKVPCNYANAFAVPVKPSKENSLTVNSIQKFVDEVNLLDQTYDMGIVERFYINIRSDAAPSSATIIKSLNEMIDKVQELI